MEGVHWRLRELEGFGMLISSPPWACLYSIPSRDEFQQSSCNFALKRHSVAAIDFLEGMRQFRAKDVDGFRRVSRNYQVKQFLSSGERRRGGGWARRRPGG